MIFFDKVISPKLNIISAVGIEGGILGRSALKVILRPAAVNQAGGRANLLAARAANPFENH